MAHVMVLLLCGVGLLAVDARSQRVVTLEVQAGDHVTILCQHNLSEPAYVNWFRHTDTSVPERLACQYYKLYSSPSPCLFVPQRRRLWMYLYSDNSSLMINKVRFTDSGLYYCCIQRSNYIEFTSATYLLVQASRVHYDEYFNDYYEHYFAYLPNYDGLYFNMAVGFGVVAAVLLCALLVLLLIFLRHRKQHRGCCFASETRE